MTKPLNILLLEDCADDAQLILRQLRRGGYDPREVLVDNAVDLQAALDRRTWDIVIADYSLPGFDGLAALRIVRARFPDLPFVVVSGDIGEETAVSAIKAGANDYLLKDRLSRLPAAVARELQAAEQQAEKRRLEDALQESNNRLRLALKNARHGMWDWDIDTDRLILDENWHAVLGYQPGELSPTLETWEQTLHPDDKQRVFSILRKHLKAPESLYDVDYRGRHKNGNWIWINTRGSVCQWDADGTPLRMMGTIHDISERKQIEQELTCSRAVLAEREEKFRVLFEYSTDAHLMFDEQQGILDCNSAAISMLRCSDKSAVLGLHPARLSPEFQPDGRRSLEKCLEMDATARRNGYHRFEWDHQRFDGEVFPCEVTLTPVPLGGKSVLLVVWQDLTERKRAEDRFRRVVEAAPNGMIVVDEMGRMVLVNAQIERKFGYTKAELIGQPVETLLPERYRERHAVHRAAFFASPQTRAMGAGRDLFGRRKDGSEFPVELGLNPLRSDQAHHVLASVIDISARKQAELELRQRADELARSNAELEQFAYVASHDLREPLRMVQSFCSLLKDRYRTRLDEVANRYIDFAVDGASRMQRLVDDLLEFSRVGRSNERFEDVALDVIARQTLEDVAAAVEESGARIEVGDLPIVHGDAVRLNQLLQNLIGNAIKFRGSAPPEIRVYANRKSDRWQITVEDNGIGISSEHFERLFVVFQRLHTRDAYDGTGIGLALCKRIVELHGGRIWLESLPGHGTSVHFELLPSTQSTNNGAANVTCNNVCPVA